MNKFEQPQIENKDQKIEKRAEEILSDLDLKIEDLNGKAVLDIGAGNADIAKAANKKGAKVFSLEQNLEFVKQGNEDFSTEGANYVEAKAEQTPFKNESFDLLISHGAPPSISATKEEIKKVIDEGNRVLKKGGEWRVGQGYLSAAAFTDLNLPKEMPMQERIAAIKDDGYKYLKEIWPGKVEEIQKGEEADQMYYKLTKEK